MPLADPAQLEVNVWFDQHLLPGVKVPLDLQQQLLLCTQDSHGCTTAHCSRSSRRDECPLTVHRYAQEEPVGDVHHDAAQQTEDVHSIQTVQIVQVCLR